MKSRDEHGEEIALIERVKELSCLYQIASIGAVHHSEPEIALEKIVHQLPAAWMFSELATAEISIDRWHFTSNNLPKSPHVQRAIINIDQKK
ncbi:MAG: hypothetical protein RLP15_10425 [Cryomorphaceae bacterium]